VYFFLAAAERRGYNFEAMKRNIVILSSGFCLLSSVCFAATNDFYGNCDVGPDAVLTGNTSTWYRVWGDFNNQTTNTGYDVFTSTFEFMGGGAHNVEQASINRGPLFSAISNNWAFGILRINGGTFTVVDSFLNSGGNDAVYVQNLTGSGVLNVGPGMVFYFASTNGWTGTVNITGNGIFRQLLPDNEDPDGDGKINWHEWLCGTEMLSSPSVLRITRIAKEGVDLRVTWTTVGSHSYILQTNSVPGTGYGDFSPTITIPAGGESTTNYVHTGAVTNSIKFFYRVRLVP
jgi:hypothetical protein